MNPTFAGHEDNRGVFIELWVLDLLGSDYAAALLLSQLLWWHQPAKRGHSRAAHERNGHRWLLRSDVEWWDECRLSTIQVRRIRKVLVERGLVITARFKRNGAPVSAWRPDMEAINEQVADAEVDDSRTSLQTPLPNEVQAEVDDSRTSLQTANGSGPLTPLPISHTQTTKDLPLTPLSPKGDGVRVVFDAWVAATGKRQAKLTDDRRGLIVRRLKQGWTVEDLCDACRGWERSAHHRGENDRGTVYNDLGLLLRDAAHIEMFRDMWRGVEPQGVARVETQSGRPINTPRSVGDRNVSTLAEWAKRKGAQG